MNTDESALDTMPVCNS